MSPFPCYNRRMNDTQYELVKEAYGNLIYKIAHNISGDIALASIDDNVQELWIAAMSAIQGYAKKENQSFDEFWGTPGFDKYLKTCLWNSKNNRGKNITKKVKVNRDVVSISEHEEVLSIIDESGLDPEFSIFIDEMMEKLTKDESRILNLIVKNPALLKPSGGVNILSLSRSMDLSWNDTSDIVDSLSTKIKNQL